MAAAGGNKEKVLLAAKELFHRKGFQPTGLEEILTHSGVCKSNFYYHFRSKDELGLAVLEEKIKDMQQLILVPSLDHPKLSAKEKIAVFFREMISYCEAYDCQRGCLLGNFTLELAEHHEAIHGRLQVFFRELEERLAAVLNDGCERGELTLRGMPADAAATAITALLQGGVLLTKAYRTSAPLASSLELLIRFLGAELEDF